MIHGLKQGKKEHSPTEQNGAFLKYAGAVFALSFVFVCAIYYCGHYFMSGSLRDANAFADIVENDLGYVLIMGVDRRDGDVGRSDTLMLAAVDEEQGRATLLSIPRDTRVEVGTYGYDKINHAYAFGGHEMTLAAVEKIVGVPVTHYVLIDTSAFERIVDAVGGVDINVEKRMHYEDPWDDNGGLVIDLQPGEQHMTGAQAIQYVRYRDGEGDIGRIARQQHFMRALLAQFLSPQVIPRLAAVVDEVKNTVETDLSTRQLLTLAKRMKDIEAGGMTMQMVIGTPAYLGDISYWIPDLVETRKELFAGVGRELSERMREAAERDASAYRADMPERLRMMAETDKRELLPSSAELLAEGDRAIEAQRAERGITTQNPAEKKEEKTEEKAATKKGGTADTAEDISVMIINASGINGAGAEIADTLRARGFRISGVETGSTSDRPKTAVMTTEAHVNLFYGMPFPCVIMPVDGAGEKQAIVIIGRDYRPNAVHGNGEE
ncbi:LCP family protein [uncultured Selenomonas sp.]|uniref:LCP family protein n=1 Tax=uncultured Selenomonas sp. TaxID=159275 RepID=UPI0028E899D7|nr:LCP family protein [uncultured Selenomonas sp.]